MGIKNYLQYFHLNESNGPISKGEKKVKLPDKKMIFSEKFMEVLIGIQNMKQSNISKRLMELENSDRLFDISYVDVLDDESVSFLQSSRIDRLIKEGKPNDEFWKTKMRTNQKIGRFIKSILPNFSEDAVEIFVKKYKGIVKELNDDNIFELVDGDDIIYWYNYKNYLNDNGTMGSSCMSGNEAGRFLNCYRNNPDKIKMLILKSGDKKIKGRALVWKLNEPENHIFMDRIYTNDEADEISFINYAKRQGWMYKSTQTYGPGETVMPNGVKKNIDMIIILDDIDFNLYPYVDTMRYFYKSDKIMSNSRQLKGNYITLTDTEGHYEEWNDDDDDYNPMVYDGYNKVEIPENRATWCEYDNGYISSDDAIRLPYNGKYAYPNSPHIVFSKYTNKWYGKVDCVFSNLLNDWIWSKYAVNVFSDKNKTNPSNITHRFELNKTIGKIGDDYYDIKILNPVNKRSIVGKDGKTKTEIDYEFLD